MFKSDALQEHSFYSFESPAAVKLRICSQNLSKLRGCPHGNFFFANMQKVVLNMYCFSLVSTQKKHFMNPKVVFFYAVSIVNRHPCIFVQMDKNPKRRHCFFSFVYILHQMFHFIWIFHTLFTVFGEYSWLHYRPVMVATAFQVVFV